MSRRLESIANMAVIGVALLVGFVLLKREFRPRSQPVPLPARALEYVPNWQLIEASGLALDSSPSAPLRVTIFTDMECSFCAKLHLRTLPELREQFGDTFAVTLVHTPIKSHRFAKQSAIAIECAADQQKHREMVDAIYEKQDSIGLRTWSAFAGDAGLQDFELFTKCMEVGTAPRIDAGLKWAEEIALQFTPTVIVNGWRFPSAPQTRDLATVFKAILAGHDPSQTDAKEDEPTTANDSTPNAQVKSLSLAHDLRIDGEKEDLTAISTLRMNSRGDIAFTQSQDAQILVYDSNGQRVSAFGRRGSGPGEFQPRALGVRGWIGDTVWVNDGTLKRVTYITREGRLVRTEQISPAARPGKNGTVANFTANSRSGDGSWLGTGSFKNTQKTYPWALVALTPTDARFVATMDEDSTYQYWEFAAGSVVGFAQNGEQVAYASANSLVRTGGKFRVHLFRNNGDTVFSREYSYTGVPLSSQRVDSVLKRGVGIDRVRTLPSNEIPPVLQPLESLHFASDGRIWITMRESQTSRSAVVLDQRGVVVAKALLPPKSRIMAADNARVWLQVEDEEGFMSLVRYRVIESTK